MHFKIGDIAACTGLAPSAIRYYETLGLVKIVFGINDLIYLPV